MEIPKLYSTEGTPLEDKIIYQYWHLEPKPGQTLRDPQAGFYWLIAELDPEEGIAFGYACLNDPQMAEWGNISIEELKSVGAVMDKTWKPHKFSEAKELVSRVPQ